MASECHRIECRFHSCHTEDDGPFCYEVECKWEDHLFRTWVESLPAKHWAKYDLSACRLGWNAGREALLKEQEKEKLTRRVV